MVLVLAVSKWAAPNVGYGALLFAFAALTDVAWVLWTRRCNAGLALQAAVFALLIYLLGAIGTIAYVDNHWYVAFLGAGSAIGTYWTVRLDHQRSQA